MEIGGTCVAAPSDGGPTCGPGTVEMDGTCVPVRGDAGPTCGPGTIEIGGECIPLAPGYIVRAAVAEIPADGYSKIPLLVIGTKQDGTPALDQVVFIVSRASAGTVSPPAPTLTPLGAISYFTPCSSTVPGCLGSFDISIALGDTPTTPVASTGQLRLVQPTGVGSPAPCLVGGNVLFFDGVNDFIFSGTQTVTQGVWSATATTNHVEVHVDPAQSSQGLWWDLDFDSMQLGQPIMEQVYENAERWPFQPPGHPGLSISGDGRGCNTLTGRFQIQDLTVDTGGLRVLTATFEQRCEGGPGVLRGCIHIEQ